MKENYIYPVIIKKEKEENMYLATFPNFPGQMTDADAEDKVIVAAQELLALCISSNEDAGIENPMPLEQEKILLQNDEKLIYVHVWMPYFRQIQKVVYVKKTLTIPKWLDEMAKEKNINFSATLVKGLKNELGIDN